MNRICTICARGGSKGVPNKNIRLLLDKPLIAHTIIQARESNLFSVIAVSSDSEEILNVADEYGADILVRRPLEMATDTAPKLPVIQHCVSTSELELKVQFDTIVDMDATSPLRTVEDIKECVKRLEESDALNLITGAEARRSPYFNLVELNENGYVDLSKKNNPPIIRRQDAPKCYDLNASVYVWKRHGFINASTAIQEKTIIYEMSDERSVDIDSELDFKIVSMLANQRGQLL